MIAPLFDGGGMKQKTAEAFSFMEKLSLVQKKVYMDNEDAFAGQS